MSEDDVRRTVSNWATYGGLIVDKPAKKRSPHNIPEPEEIVFDEERAVLPIKLLRQVAATRKKRSRKRPTDHGRKQKNRFYALSNITYCAHCEALAIQHDDPKFRTTLTGATQNGRRRYRHKTGVKCGVNARTVWSETIEDDFERLISLLTVDEELLEEMKLMALEIDRQSNPDGADLETQKEEAITLCKRRIRAARVLFADGVTDEEEYRYQLEKNEREIAHWQARTTDTEQITLEFAMCMEAVQRISSLWEMSDDEDRQGLVRNLFTEIVYDLDKQRIISFKLKPWADRFLVLAGKLYADKMGDNDSQILCTEVPHTGFKHVSVSRFKNAVRRYLSKLYHGLPYPKGVVNDATQPKVARNQAILKRYQRGESIASLAKLFDISEQRVHQILRQFDA